MSLVKREGYYQAADIGTDKIGRYLFGDAWTVTPDQVEKVVQAIKAEGTADALLARIDAEAPAQMMVSQAGLGSVAGRAGALVGRLAGRLAPRAAQAVKKVAGGWLVWTGAEWIFSKLRPDGASAPRRMNVMNVRALNRADRRVQGFAARAVPQLKKLGYVVDRHKKPGSGSRHTHADHHPRSGYNSKEWMAKIRGMRKSK